MLDVGSMPRRPVRAGTARRGSRHTGLSVSLPAGALHGSRPACTSQGCAPPLQVQIALVDDLLVSLQGDQLIVLELGGCIGHIGDSHQIRVGVQHDIGREG